MRTLQIKYKITVYIYLLHVSYPTLVFCVLWTEYWFPFGVLCFVGAFQSTSIKLTLL